MNDNAIERAKSLIFDNLNGVDWSRGEYVTVFTSNGSSNPVFTLFDSKSELLNYDFQEIFSLTRIFKGHFFERKEDPDARFNKVIFNISSDGETEYSFTWEDEEIKKQKAKWAEVFPQWVHDRLISLLFSAGYGTEQDWQRGEFSFTIRAGKFVFRGVIYNGDVPTEVHLKLPDYLIEGILEHHQLTNEGLLKEQWQVWNELVIRSPHNDLDLAKDVTYRLVTQPS